MTATDLKIEDLFEKNIKRDIDGVIKVDKEDEQSVYTELDEYVVTKESLKHFDTFFGNYAAAQQVPTDKTGVWVSGFFGSGKSHFIKILSYLLENRTVKGKTALEFFREKIPDTGIFGNIEKSVKTGTRDVILFNIDSKANTESKGDEQIVNIFMRAFNEMRGYMGDVFWISDLEEDLEDRGLYDSFKSEFKNINGETWEERRVVYNFEQDDIVEALANCGAMSREAASRLFESDGATYNLSVEKFAKKLEKYCKAKGKDHQVIFLVDEIGQYIGENSELMLNLQTVVEELGTKLRGKAWVVVTSQADIDTVTREHVRGNDFSKIQGRFDTRLSLSSANVDEVIKERVLKKKKEHEEDLSAYYSEKQTILRNLLAFSKAAEMKVYKGEEDFVSVYPFVPYQFNLVQKVLERVRETGFTGKHLAKGERSMLGAFMESAQKHCGENIGKLIPFHTFYETISGFLDPVIFRTISQAKDNNLLDEGDCELLEILFMIRNLKEIDPNLDNLTVLSVSSVDEDKIKLKERISASLSKLENQTLISKSEDRYYFLTNEEQEIDKDIKRTEIEEYRILEEVYEALYDQKGICPPAHKIYRFNKAVDGRVKTTSNADLTVKFLTPLSEEYFNKGGQRSLDGYNLSNIDSTDTLLFVFPEADFIEKIKSYLKIEKYLKQSSSNINNPEKKTILATKQQDAERARLKAREFIENGISDAKVFVDNKEVEIGKSNPKDRMKAGIELLISNVYNKKGYITLDYENESDVLRVLRSDDLEKWGNADSDTNKQALKEMLEYISLKHERGARVLLKDLKERYMKKPYGWKDMTISGLVAVLYTREEIKLRYQSEYLVNDAESTAKHLKRGDEADKLLIEIREKTGEEDLRTVKTILKDLFEKINLPEKEGDLYDSVRGTLTDEYKEIQKLESEYDKEKGLPGRPQIEAYSLFLKEMLETTDQSAFFRNLASRKTEFEDLHENAIPVKNFFKGFQVEIFRDLLTKYDGFSRNLQFLDEEAKADLEEVNRILILEEPYSEIRKLRSLKSNIEASVELALSAQKEKVEKKLSEIREEIEKALSDEKFPGEFNKSLLAPFGEIEKITEGAEDCALVQIQLSMLDSCRTDAYERIDRENQIIRQRPEKAPYGNEDGPGGTPAGPETYPKGPEGPKADPGNEAEPTVVPVQKSTRFITEISFFRSEDLIESEEDIDTYIMNLKSKMMEILNEKNIRV